MMPNVSDRFLKYISIDTTSIDDATEYPSSPNQWILAKLLCEEMKAIGLKDVEVDSYGYVTGTIPANTDREIPVLGFLSHMDTSNAVSGADIKASIIVSDGEDILLNKEKDIWLRKQEYPEICRYKGQHLIVTDGTTLLGADDKAGIAEIMTAAERLLGEDAPPHGTIRIGFTPDEEVGEGTKFFDIERFGAQFAYTVDGEAVGELECENFNAASAQIYIHGKSMHPGYSKNRMVNAILIGMELQSMLPQNETPSHTEGYEGFYHLEYMEGDVESCSLVYIIRDHSRDLFEKRKDTVGKLVDDLNDKYGAGTIDVEIKDSYYNMKEIIDQNPILIDNALEAYKRCGIEPKMAPVRGGTDGARLSYKGLPCPNLSTGGHNFHSVLEFVPVESMEKMVEVLIELVQLF